MTVKLSFPFAAIPEWVLYHPGLDALDVRVYGVLWRHGEQSYPGHDRIGALVGKSHDSVARSLNRLAKVGAIRVEPRYRDDGGRTTNLYTIAGEAPMPPVSRTDASTVAAEAPTPAPRTDASGTIAMVEREQLNDTPSARAEAAPLALALPEEEPGLWEAFWRAYPRKVGKPDAFKAWKAVAAHKGGAGPEAERVMEGLVPWLRYWQARAEPEYVPHPATWLRQRRWEDAPPPVGRRAGRKDVAAVGAAMTFDSDGNLVG